MGLFPLRPRETEKFVIPDSITTLALDFVPSPLDAWIREEWILGNNLFAFASHYQEVVILLHTTCQSSSRQSIPIRLTTNPLALRRCIKGPPPPGGCGYPGILCFFFLSTLPHTPDPDNNTCEWG